MHILLGSVYEYSVCVSVADCLGQLKLVIVDNTLSCT